MENNQINSSGSGRKYYKSILTTIAIIALAASTTYLLFQNNRQKQIMQNHEKAINALRSINNNHLMVNINDYLNSVFNDHWFSFRKFFSDMENQISEFRHNFDKNNRNNAINIISNEQEYIVTALLPGFSKDEITIKLSGSNLEIRAKHSSKDNSDEGNKDTLSKQAEKHIKYGVTVPANIDQNSVTAQLNNGLLTIRFSRIIDQTPVKTKEIVID